MEWTDWKTRRVAFKRERERAHGLTCGVGPRLSPIYVEARGSPLILVRSGLPRGGTQSSGTKDIDSKYTRMSFLDGPRPEEPDPPPFPRAKACCGLMVDVGTRQPRDSSLRDQTVLLQLRKAAELPSRSAKSSAQACGRGRPLKGPRCGVEARGSLRQEWVLGSPRIRPRWR